MNTVKTSLLHEDPEDSHAILQTDYSNMFGEVFRVIIREELEQYFPELCHLFDSLYSQEGNLVWLMTLVGN